MRHCRKCGARPATIPKAGNARRETPRYCQTCWQAFPGNQRAQSTRLNPKRRAQARQKGRHLIRIGRRYVGYAKTIEQVEQIKAHIRERLNAFKSGQSQRADREGGAARGVSLVSDDRATEVGRARVVSGDRSAESGQAGLGAEREHGLRNSGGA